MLPVFLPRPPYRAHVEGGVHVPRHGDDPHPTLPMISTLAPIRHTATAWNKPSPPQERWTSWARIVSRKEASDQELSQDRTSGSRGQ